VAIVEAVVVEEEISFENEQEAMMNQSETMKLTRTTTTL
jgi:hypothetical protein